MDGMKIDESLIPKIIGIVVAVIVAAVVLIPITEEATTTTGTFTNAGYFRMSEINSDDTDTYVISWDVTTPNTITVNDEPIQLNLSDAPSQVSVIFNGDWVCRANLTNGEIASIAYISNNGGVTASSTIVCTLSGGNMSLVVDSTSNRTEDYAIAYIPDPAGAFTMKKSTESAYVLGDSKLAGFGLSFIRAGSGGSAQRGISFNGSIDDGVDPTIWLPPSDTSTTLTDVEINAIQESKYNDLYVLTNITMVCNNTVDEQTAQTDLTYSYFLVPYEVTSEKAIHPDAMTNTIISTIPIFVVLAILMGIVGLMYFNRNQQ